VKYNSPLKEEHGDALIFGARDMRQLKETLDTIKKGPLSQRAAQRIDELWATIMHEAPLDNIHR
jgi:aryl-alcohol dehydrogenase-like predicted oxidoreductase